MVHRTFSLALALVFGINFAARGEEVDCYEYRIEAIISIIKPDGEFQVKSRATLQTIERRPASLHTGKATRVAIQDDEVVDMETGITCQFTPYPLQEGGVKLDIEIEIVQESGDMDKSIVTETFGNRRVQQVPLGVRVEIPMACRGKKPTHRLELTVTENPRLFVGDDVPPPPIRIGRRDAVPAPQKPADENIIQR